MADNEEVLFKDEDQPPEAPSGEEALEDPHRRRRGGRATPSRSNMLSGQRYNGRGFDVPARLQRRGGQEGAE